MNTKDVNEEASARIASIVDRSLQEVSVEVAPPQGRVLFLVFGATEQTMARDLQALMDYLESCAGNFDKWTILGVGCNERPGNIYEVDLLSNAFSRLIRFSSLQAYIIGNPPGYIGTNGNALAIKNWLSDKPNFDTVVFVGTHETQPRRILTVLKHCKALQSAWLQVLLWGELKDMELFTEELAKIKYYHEQDDCLPIQQLTNFVTRGP